MLFSSALPAYFVAALALRRCAFALQGAVVDRPGQPVERTRKPGSAAMKYTRKVGFIGIVFVTLILNGQVSRSSYDPAANRPGRQRNSFVDFVLKKLNPQDIDYGQKIEEVRRAAAVATIDDYYFWSNFGAVCALALIFSLFFRQHTLLKRRALSTARLVTWYHNELVEARNQAFEQGAKCLALQRSLDDQIESTPAQNGNPVKGDAIPKESSESVGASGAPVQTGSDQALRDSLKKLEQQASRDKETINSLRRQTSILSRRLQEEQQKSRSVTSA
jgi:hypothetical protein